MGKESCSGSLMVWLALALSVVALLTAGGDGVIVQQDGKDVLTIAGTSELSVAPDKAEVSLRVETKGIDAVEVQGTNKASANKVIEALTDMGVSEDDIQSTDYRLEVNREWNEDLRTYEDNGYRLYHVLMVSLTDLNMVGGVIDSAVSAGANGVDGVQFGLTDELLADSRDDALAAAAGKAKEKARNLAGSLGVTLGKPVRISESSYNFVPYRAVAYDMAMEESMASSKVLPEDVKVQVTVNVDYEIR